MKQFFNSLWFGALFVPKLWKYAFMKGSALVLFIVAGFFILIDIVCASLHTGSILLILGCALLFWIADIILPFSTYSIKEKDGKKIFFFIYGQDKSYLSKVEDVYAYVRAFEKDGKHWKLVQSPLRINRYDARICSHGFFLIKDNSYEWQLIGNGYDFYPLGVKLADYAFYKEKFGIYIYMIHLNTLIKKHIYSYDKDSNIFLEAPYNFFEEGEKDFTTPNQANFIDGCGGVFFVLKEKTNTLYKVIFTAENEPLAYAVSTRCFTIPNRVSPRVYENIGENKYKLISPKN